MQTIAYHWEHPIMEPYKKIFPKDSCLFRQGAVGKTMFLIVKGVVRLVSAETGHESAVAFVGAGEFLGERAVIERGIHRRVFGAYAATELTCFELGISALESIELKDPALFKDILRHMFLDTARRLHNSNRLLKATRSSDNSIRLPQLIAALAESTGVATHQGIDLTLTPDQIRYYIDMDEQAIKTALKELAAGGALIYWEKDRYIIPNVQKLVDLAPALEQAPVLNE